MTIRICIWGAWYESKNAGDQAILMSIASLLAERLPHVELTVFSNRPALTEHYMERLPFNNLNVRAVSQRHEFPKVITALRRADLFLIGGGTPIYDDRFHLFAFWLLVAIAKSNGAKVMTYAVSARPIRDPISRWLCRQTLRSVPILTTRETNSVSIIRELLKDPSRKIETYTDPVVMFRPPSGQLPTGIAKLVEEATAGTRKLVAICPHFFSADHSYRVHHYEKFRPEAIENYYASLAQLSDQLRKRATVLFLPMNTEAPDNDTVAIRAIQKQMQYTEGTFTVTEELTPAQIVTTLRSCKLIVGTRLHSLVFASIAYTPMVAVSYGPKVAGFMKSLGLEAQVHSFNGLDADRLCSTTDSTWHVADLLRQQLMKRMPGLEILAEANADRAISLVANRVQPAPSRE